MVLVRKKKKVYRVRSRLTIIWKKVHFFDKKCKILKIPQYSKGAKLLKNAIVCNRLTKILKQRYKDLFIFTDLPIKDNG